MKGSNALSTLMNRLENSYSKCCLCVRYLGFIIAVIARLRDCKNYDCDAVLFGLSLPFSFVYQTVVGIFSVLARRVRSVCVVTLILI